MDSKPSLPERHIDPLVALSGSYLAMLEKFSDLVMEAMNHIQDYDKLKEVSDKLNGVCEEAHMSLVYVKVIAEDQLRREKEKLNDSGAGGESLSDS